MAGGVQVLERLVLHGPQFATGDRRSGLLDVGREHDGASRPTDPAKDDVVVAVGVQKDAAAIEGIQPAVQAAERRTGTVGEAHVGNARPRCCGDGEDVAAGITHRACVAAEGRPQGRADAQGAQASGEGGRQGRHEDVVIVGVSHRAQRDRRVLQPGGFVQNDVDTGGGDAGNAVSERVGSQRVIGGAVLAIGSGGAGRQQKGGSRRVVGVHIPGGSDAAIGRPIQVACSAVGDVPGVVPVPGVGVDQIVRRAPLTIRSRPHRVLHLELHRAAERKSVSGDGGGAAGCVIVQVSADTWLDQGSRDTEVAARIVIISIPPMLALTVLSKGISP